MTHSEKLRSLQRQLDRKSIRYFKAKEFFAKGGANSNPRSRGYRKNTDPPDRLIHDIVPCAIVLDRIREDYGSAIVINSCYRSPAYNRSIGGASQSYHMKFVACDITGYSISRLHRIAKDLRNQGMFLGGIGRYNSFVHVDTRGYNATW